jgi:hypothetical protein
MFLDPKSNFYLFFNLKTPLKHYINLKNSFNNSKTHQNHSKKQELIKSHKPNETQSIFLYIMLEGKPHPLNSSQENKLINTKIFFLVVRIWLINNVFYYLQFSDEFLSLLSNLTTEK